MRGRTRFTAPAAAWGGAERSLLGTKCGHEATSVTSPMRMRGLEPPRTYVHTDLNRARLPIPPHPRGAGSEHIARGAVSPRSGEAHVAGAGRFFERLW